MGDATIGRRSLLGGAGVLLSGAMGARAATAAKPKVAIKTSHGVFVVELEAQKAPLTSTNFLRYVDAGKYDGGSFFRAVRDVGLPSDGTIVGGPAPRTHPYPPIAHESTTMTGLRHVAGTISLGRFDPGSATSAFFICTGPEPYYDAHPEARPVPHGDNLGFAAFGQVVRGMAVVRKIHSLRTDAPSPFPDQKGQWLNPPAPILSMRRTTA